MNCSRFETLLSDYMDGALALPVHQAAAEHLHGCSECSVLLADVRKLREDLEHFPRAAVSDELIQKILIKTAGIPKEQSFWNDLILPTIRPFLSQRYAFATIMMFVFISLAVNVMGPGFEAFSYSSLRPSSWIAQADRVGNQIYSRWREFSDFKSRIADEIVLLKEDLFGRLDYHLVTILFRSYNESLKEESESANEQGTDSSITKQAEPKEEVPNNDE